MTAGMASTAAPPKVDPETLVLRSRPPGAVRFRRGLIVGAAAIGSASLIGITWMALQPRIFHNATQESELSPPSRQATASELSNLPSTYGDVPKLGPPLPGDLGRPILRARRMAEGSEMRPSSRERQFDAERQARRDAILSARQSPVFVQTAGRSIPVDGAASTSPYTPDAPRPASPPPTQSPRERFASAFDPRGDANPHAVVAPVSPFVLSAGSVIAASLVTGLNSDIPGMVIAQVTQDIHDSPTGRMLLVAQGSRLVGSYDSEVSYGQNRLRIIWQRLILADGRSLRLHNVPATDAAGRAGLVDRVDRHVGGLLVGLAISTVLSVSEELALGGRGRLIDAIRQGSGQGASRMGDRLVGKQLDVPPTIVVRPGAPVRLLVQRDLILEAWSAS